MNVVRNGKLADCAANLELFINQISDYALYMLDTSGHVMSWNAGAQRLYCYSSQEIIGCHFSDFFMSEDRVTNKPGRALEIASQEGIYQEEGVRVRKDHTCFWAAVTITVLKGQDGKLQGFADLTHDVTERKTNEARYRALYENSHDAIVLTRPKDGAILSANPAALKLFGYPQQELLSMQRDQVLDQNDPRFVDAWVERKTIGAVAAELTFIHKSGTRFEARVSSKLFTDERGDQVACTSIHDITERKQAEEALRQSEERVRLLYENAPVGIIQFDRNGRLTSANKTYAEISGYSQDELIGFSHCDVMLPEDQAISMEQGNALLSGSRDTFIDEGYLLRKDGSTIWARGTARMIYDQQGKPQSGIMVVENVNDKKQAEDALRQSEARFRLLYENAPIGIVQTDHNGYVVSANSKFAEISGYPSDEIAGFIYIDTALPEDKAFARELMRKLTSGESETENYERRMQRKDGSIIWVRVNARRVHDKQGQAPEGIVIYEDITPRKQVEDALRQSEEKFRATFEHAPIGIAECTVEGRFIEVNSKLVEILGYTKDEFAHLTTWDVTHPGDMEATHAVLRKLAASETDSYVMEKRYLRKDRSFVWVSVTASLAPIHGRPKYLIVTVEDITARKKAEEDLKRAIESSYYQANHDMLTGLANRAHFHDRLKEALAYAKRDGHQVALHLVDLDRFKSINDTLGHHIGDLLLKEVAKRIRSHVRVTDLAARLGGDEFVVIQTHLAEPAAAGVLAGKLVEDMGRTYVLEDQEVNSGASIGIALYPGDDEDPDELMKHADLALYDAKHRGRFNCQFYRKELGIAFRELQQREQELVRALRENEFFLHYQPQFDLQSGRITGIEALLRWAHPAKGRLAAVEFIQDAERARLMVPIGEWTLRTACRQYKEWVDSGLSVPLTLNLSAMQLRDVRLLEILKKTLSETGLPASMLQLEMRENLLWDPKFSRGLLQQLKESGLRLALDAFGAELTALPTLHRLPLDLVKPGQGVVNELPSGKREATILAAIIGVAHNLKMAVCAEGVETADQFTAVKEQGCDSAQGYLLSSPLDAHEMGQLVELELAH